MLHFWFNGTKPKTLIFVISGWHRRPVSCWIQQRVWSSLCGCQLVFTESFKAKMGPRFIHFRGHNNTAGIQRSFSCYWKPYIWGNDYSMLFLLILCRCIINFSANIYASGGSLWLLSVCALLIKSLYHTTEWI